MQIIDNQTKQIINKPGLPANIICFSHLRWDFVFQRPQHLFTRFAKDFRIFFLEEPITGADSSAHYTYQKRGNNITVIVPHIPAGLSPLQERSILKALFSNFMQPKNSEEFIFWYYTPMALEFSRKFTPKLTVFDCMDELSAFKFAPDEIKQLEKELLQKADVVFTGGKSLYQAKKNQHVNIHPFPSSIDKQHFNSARQLGVIPDKQIDLNPKIGFFGVIDERFDAELIRNIADSRPNWQIDLIGPIVKIDPQTLPKNPNIHYLGPKKYDQLPQYMAGWNVALIPFLLNESTKFISPTKTPEYLAAGLPVVSTPIRDVIDPYGNKGLVNIAHNAADFIKAIEAVLNSLNDKADWLKKVDNFLARNSWEKTCKAMLKLMEETNCCNQMPVSIKAQA